MSKSIVLARLLTAARAQGLAADDAALPRFVERQLEEMASEEGEAYERTAEGAATFDRLVRDLRRALRRGEGQQP